MKIGKTLEPLLNIKVGFHVLMIILLIISILLIYTSYELKMEKRNNQHQIELRKYDIKIDSINNINDSLKLVEFGLKNKVININNTINKITNEKDLTYLNDANVYQLTDYFREYLSKSNN